MSVATTAAPVRKARAGHPFVILLVAAALAALFTMLLAPAGPAHAAAYRYWGYYQLKDGAWAFASKGPAELTPKDGSVDGWRFAVTGASKDVRDPRATPSFGEICGDTAAVDGKKRVGVVIDYGRPADGSAGAKPPAAVAECAQVDEAAHGDEVLASVADVRAQKGLVCAINAYPAQGCGEEVKDVSAAAKKPDTPVQLTVAGKAASTPAPSTDATSTATSTAASTAGAVPSSSPSSDNASVQASASQDRSDEGSGTGTGTWVGVGVVILAVLAVGAVALRRRQQP
ncbi:SCO2322 family protein [Segeticoccus rhizosphaerae]|uniref:SCO2322 family protein n=1 Tax=Segeticoccus rhizosphaerae TaxID=1104777 RepID=UPI001EE4DB55|nr:SCO2322 family protein [Ornithinicoccus soli]